MQRVASPTADWEPDSCGKGLWLPSGRVATWRVDDSGSPSHDQAAKLLDVDLVECVPFWISEDACAELLRTPGPRTVEGFRTAAIAHDARLWFRAEDDA